MVGSFRNSIVILSIAACFVLFALHFQNAGEDKIISALVMDKLKLQASADDHEGRLQRIEKTLAEVQKASAELNKSSWQQHTVEVPKTSAELKKSSWQQHTFEVPKPIAKLDLGAPDGGNLWEEVVPSWATSSPPTGAMVVVENVPRKQNLKSQKREDQTLWERFFFRQGHGTFLEMGALDGFDKSNTYAFDKDLEWKGILIEGDPGSFEKMKKNRPNQILVRAAVCAQRRTVHYVRKGPVGGIWEFMSDKFKSVWYPDEKKTRMFPMECVPMGDILSRYAIEHVNLWSLDVEGSELEVLKTVDFARFTFDVVLIETNVKSKDTNKQVWDLMNKTGVFDYAGKIADNDIWVSKSFVPKRKP